MAAGSPYGVSLSFTGRRGRRRIIALRYNFFHFYVRRSNWTCRSHAVERFHGARAVALWYVAHPAGNVGPLESQGGREVAVRSPAVAVRARCGYLAFALVFGKNLRPPQRRPTATVRHHFKGRTA